VLLVDLLNEKMSIAARKKLAKRAKKNAKKIMRKRAKKMKKKRGSEDLKKAALGQAKRLLMQKIIKKDPADMTIQDKMRFSKKLKPGKIQKVAKKLLPKLKKAEADRAKKMQIAKAEKA